MRESHVELARRGYEAALRGDLDVISGLLDPDVTWHGGDASAPGACHNRQQARGARQRRGRVSGEGVTRDALPPCAAVGEQQLAGGAGVGGQEIPAVWLSAVAREHEDAPIAQGRDEDRLVQRRVKVGE
jgi:ketosteroid isomerase-like protein